MAYIQPNTDIYLLSGINWTNNYEDTVHFVNKSVQLNYFKGKVVKTYTQQSYQRQSKNSLRILETADKIYNCNYLMFQNKSYGTKWFYAFITNCEYINDNTTEITYEIDEIQTWFWDLQLGQCFVEREIPASDNLYENLVPESLEIGEYIVNTNVPTNLGEPCYLMCCATDIDGDPSTTVLGMHKFTLPLKYYSFLCDTSFDPEGLSTQVISYAINKYYEDNNSPENIIAITAIPSILLSTEGSLTPDFDSVGLKMPNYYLETEWFFDTHIALNGYIPKNNKLHTYPYRCLQVSNNSGQINTYKYEDFNINLYDDPRFYFKIIGTIYGLPSIMLIPENYRGVYLNYDESCVLTNFPTMPWITDTYKAYLAQNKASITTSLLTSAVSGLIGLGNAYSSFQGAGQMNDLYSGYFGGTRNLAGISTTSTKMANTKWEGIQSLANAGAQIASTLSKISDIKQQPDKVHGLSQCDTLLTITKKMQFEVYTVSIKAEMAKIIDDYFTAYGYAQHKFKVPNINARPYWSYVQTKGCILKGSCPANTKAFISKCFDTGIRFWSSNEIIGNYDLDNSPR